MRTLTLTIILAMSLSLSSLAQPEMIVEHYTRDNGLPSNTVYGALRDKDGFMWFGTWYGLCSFDGVTFTPFITRSNNALETPPRKVRNMLEDKDGYIWIRNTDNHLYLFDRVKDVYRDVYDDLKRLSKNVQVVRIALIDNGRLLVMTRDKDLYEVSVDANRRVKISKIYDSARDIDAATMRLRRGVLGESDKYIYWISGHVNVEVVSKRDRKRVLAGVDLGKDFTCFRRDGRYLRLGTRDGEIYVADLERGVVRREVFAGVGQAVSTIDMVGARCFFSTSAGLYSYKKGEKPRIVDQKASRVSASFVDGHDKLWLYSDAGYLIRHDPIAAASRQFVMPTDSLFADMKFQDMGVNGLFMLLRNGEVWRYDHDTGSMTRLNDAREFNGNNLPKPHFFDMDLNEDGTLWLSSTTSGVYKVCFPPYNFRFILSDVMGSVGDNERGDGVRSVFQARNGDLWVGTRGGALYCVDPVKMAVRHVFGKDEIGAVYHIMEDKQGNLWFSTKGSGLIKATYDAKAPSGFRVTRYVNRKDDPNSLSNNKVYCTYQDSHGRIWVGTFYGGLNLMEQRGDKVVFKHSHNGFRNYPLYDLYIDIRSIVEDKNGRVWVGTTDGLMSFDVNFKNTADIKFETYRNQRGTSAIDNDISTMYKDREGYVWMGIFGNGLKRLDSYDERGHRPVLGAYALSDNQGGDVISSIVEDQDNNLWVCTETGLACVNRGTSFVRSYDRFAGFPEVTIEDNAMLCLRDGRVLIGCRQGLLAFNPKAVMDYGRNSYETYITDFKVGNRPLRDFNPPIFDGSLKYADKIELSYEQSTFTIEFSAPHFSDNLPLAYSYILDGYEKEWHDRVDTRVASYSNVPPGRYRFRVKVNDNVSPERVIEVVILPPWWATWWAYTIYALLALLALYGAMRLFLYMTRIRNEVYINDRLAELKIKFFTNVSHELRTPLSLIHGPIEELKNEENMSPAGREYLGLIDRNANKMLMLVNQILDFRKIQHGKMKLHVSFVDVNEIIEMLMTEYAMLAEERDISFVFEKPEEHVMMWCDAEKIGIVLNNLISNAFKFTAEGGTICVALEHDYEREICTIRVEDDGVGIPKSQLELIFERFHQVAGKNPDDSTFGGTGIGLSLSKEYIAMHGGRIWAENIEKGGGVVFSVELHTGKEHFDGNIVEVYLDDGTAEKDSRDEASETSRDGEDARHDTEVESKPLIMLIEDNVDMCRMLRIQLQDKYKVMTAHEGGEGLRKIYKYHPDIIITDIMMPGVNGLDLLRDIRQDFNISHIPVIVLTAKNTEEDKMKAIKFGANAFIVKPFGRDHLMARIGQLLEEQRIFQRKIVVRSAVGGESDADDGEYERHLVKKDKEFINKIHSIIEENLNSNDFNIDTIAGTIGLSRSAFFKKLKSLTGFAPVDLVREIRLNKAARLIETTDNSITEIAYSVGFRDAGYFGKCFRKKYDMTPKEYRRRKTE